ncbi:FecR family protein [Parapedobacter sp. 10938]|uniref:FecR family protein n=1 Tax=Parapedobacter flavus TaxID=3110225 RepID=UPI002DBAD17A|nr:FecR domain-containing protein [Parapedobacter sp. 10938]MEC3879154.1 FecR domain-containing protein [Parapedobacter sp. 10938]
MNEKRLKELLARYLAGSCSDAERAWVEAWYGRFNHDVEDGQDHPFPDHEIREDLAAIQTGLPVPAKKSHRFRRWLPYAAAVLALAIVSAWFIADNQHIGQSGPDYKASQMLTQDIEPGGHRATLTLADGRTVDLRSDQTGVVLKDDMTYLDGTAVLSQEIHENKSNYVALTTPKGGTYCVTLPDGTVVWLNAASHLEYREDTIAHLRLVKLDGEAFFEVKSDKHRPFKVQTKGQEVEVLGTSFNINSYSDEPAIRTTLAEGSLKVRDESGLQAVVLKPGQQATLGPANRLEVHEVLVDDVVAWKSGMFSFNNTDIEAVMRQLSRWYDVAVEFEGDIPKINLWGEVYRDVNASEALAILQFFGLKYSVEQQADTKRIVISNEHIN